MKANETSQKGTTPAVINVESLGKKHCHQTEPRLVVDLTSGSTKGAAPYRHRRRIDLHRGAQADATAKAEGSYTKPLKKQAKANRKTTAARP